MRKTMSGTSTRRTYAYEYGRRWLVKVPRYSIGVMVDRLHVGTSDDVILARINTALAIVGPEFTPQIKRDCREYALERHRRNRALYLKVMRG